MKKKFTVNNKLSSPDYTNTHNGGADYIWLCRTVMNNLFGEYNSYNIVVSDKKLEETTVELKLLYNVDSPAKLHAFVSNLPLNLKDRRLELDVSVRKALIHWGFNVNSKLYFSVKGVE